LNYLNSAIPLWQSFLEILPVTISTKQESEILQKAQNGNAEPAGHSNCCHKESASDRNYCHKQVARGSFGSHEQAARGSNGGHKEVARNSDSGHKEVARGSNGGLSNPEVLLKQAQMAGCWVSTGYHGDELLQAEDPVRRIASGQAANAEIPTVAKGKPQN